jgi:hypothetical protein
VISDDPMSSNAVIHLTPDGANTITLGFGRSFGLQSLSSEVMEGVVLLRSRSLDANHPIRAATSP